MKDVRESKENYLKEVLLVSRCLRASKRMMTPAVAAFRESP